MILLYFKRCTLMALLFSFSFTSAFSGPLLKTAEEGDLTQIKRLRSQSANIHARDKWNATPLHSAAFKGKTKTVKLLLAQGANIHAKDNRGKTALDYARQESRKATIKLLQKYGAN